MIVPGTRVDAVPAHVTAVGLAAVIRPAWIWRRAGDGTLPGDSRALVRPLRA